MILLIFYNEVQETVEVITAVPKMSCFTIEQHREKLRPVAEEFAARRDLDGRRLRCPMHKNQCGCPRKSLVWEAFPLYLEAEDLNWSKWVSHGVAYDYASDYELRVVDTTPNSSGVGIGPAWDGIKIIDCPIGDWTNGGVELNWFDDGDNDA